MNNEKKEGEEGVGQQLEKTDPKDEQNPRDQRRSRCSRCFCCCQFFTNTNLFAWTRFIAILFILMIVIVAIAGKLPDSPEFMQPYFYLALPFVIPLASLVTATSALLVVYWIFITIKYTAVVYRYLRTVVGFFASDVGILLGLLKSTFIGPFPTLEQIKNGFA